MVGIFPTIYRGDESLPIQEICAKYRGRLATARWGQNDGSVAHSAEYIFGTAPAIGTYRGRHSEVRCCSTALQSTYNCFPLAERPGLGLGLEVAHSFEVR